MFSTDGKLNKKFKVLSSTEKILGLCGKFFVKRSPAIYK